MAMLQRRFSLDSARVTFISPEHITPNPDQPRKNFDTQSLSELADSIRIHGIIQPLTVRRRAGGRFELIAGERRLRAALLCGLSQVPCIVMDVSREGSCALSLIENVQRRDLDFLEEAQALERLINLYGLSQEECANQVGKSQSAIANKLRLLRLSPEILDLFQRNGCTERHARALLRLPNEETQLRAARLVVEQGLTVAKTEQYVAEYLDSLYAPPALPPASEAESRPQEIETARPRPQQKTRILIKDVRFFLNTVSNGLSRMQSAGLKAQCDQVEEEDSILLTIRIPKQAGAGGKK